MSNRVKGGALAVPFAALFAARLTHAINARSVNRQLSMTAAPP
jgi:hypothetical protein